MESLRAYVRITHHPTHAFLQFLWFSSSPDSIMFSCMCFISKKAAPTKAVQSCAVAIECGFGSFLGDGQCELVVAAPLQLATSQTTVLFWPLRLSTFLSVIAASCSPMLTVPSKSPALPPVPDAPAISNPKKVATSLPFLMFSPHLHKLIVCLKNLSYGLESEHCDPVLVTQTVCADIYKCVTTSWLDELAVQTIASLTTSLCFAIMRGHWSQPLLLIACICSLGQGVAVMKLQFWCCAACPQSSLGAILSTRHVVTNSSQCESAGPCPATPISSYGSNYLRCCPQF